MRKTNSKETRRAVEAYVMDEVADILERCGIVDPMRPVDAAFNVLRDEMEYQHATRNGVDLVGRGIANMYKKSGRMYSNYIPALDTYNVWYLAAAAGCFSVHYDHMRALLAEWLEETPEEAARYGNDKVCELYRHLTAAAFDRLHDKECKPRKVNTSQFIELYNSRNGGHFFDRETLKYWGQTRKDFDITENVTIKDHNGAPRDVYRVEYVYRVNGRQHLSVAYFDRKTFEEVHRIEECEEM